MASMSSIDETAARRRHLGRNQLLQQSASLNESWFYPYFVFLLLLSHSAADEKWWPKRITQQQQHSQLRISQTVLMCVCGYITRKKNWTAPNRRANKRRTRSKSNDYSTKGFSSSNHFQSRILLEYDAASSGMQLLADKMIRIPRISACIQVRVDIIRLLSAGMIVGLVWKEKKPISNKWRHRGSVPFL